MTLFLFALLAGPAAPVPADSNPLTAAVTSRYRIARENILDSAALMPEESYGFRLTRDQRTFAEWLTHTAAGNARYCAEIEGKRPPAEPHLAGGATKADIERALRRSFESCDEVLARMDDAKALTRMGGNEGAAHPVDGMVALIAFLNSHYGNMVGYLRAKGITPPSTARQNRRIPLPEQKMRKGERK